MIAKFKLFNYTRKLLIKWIQDLIKLWELNLYHSIMLQMIYIWNKKIYKNNKFVYFAILLQLYFQEKCT